MVFQMKNAANTSGTTRALLFEAYRHQCYDETEIIKVNNYLFIQCGPQKNNKCLNLISYLGWIKDRPDKDHFIDAVLKYRT